MHDFAGELIASAGSSSASIVTPPNFHFVSLNQGVVRPTQGVNLQCRFTMVLDVDALGGSDMALNAMHEMKRPELEGTLRLWMENRAA
jgi:hypothetical protein